MRNCASGGFSCNSIAAIANCCTSPPRPFVGRYGAYFRDGVCFSTSMDVSRNARCSTLLYTSVYRLVVRWLAPTKVSAMLVSTEWNKP
jgi:hypothetical protein